MSRRVSVAALAALGVVGALSAGTYAYTSYTSSRWPNAAATFYVNTGSVVDVSPSAAVAAIQVGMNAWNTSGSAIRLSYGGTTSKNQLALDYVNAIFFRQESKGSSIASNYTYWDGAGHLIDSDIVFWDYGRLFFTGTSGCTSGAYIEDVAAHELGHGIGLDHSSIADATMYSGYGSCSQALRTLAADDIAGAKALYPGGSSSTTNSAPTITISSPANGASYAQGVSVSFNGSAFDSQDGNLTSAMQWTDNGTAIGAGGLLSRVLTVGTHSIVAYANDSGGLQGKKTISVTVAAATTSGSSTSTSAATLTARARKSRRLWVVDLSWTGVSGATEVDVYRTGSKLLSRTPNDGAQTDALNQKGGGTYYYQVCASVLNTPCTNIVKVVF